MGSWSWDLGERSTRELLTRCCSLSMAAHQSPLRTSCSSGFPPASCSSPSSSPPPSPAYAVFAFPATWSADDWFSEQVSDPFGASKVDGSLFPSLRTIVDGVPAVVNAGFLRCFRRILQDSSLQAEVDRALKWNRQIVFAGHSSGGSIATLAAIWLLEAHKLRHSQYFPLCVTFGSPLLGSNILTYSVLREGWSCCFLNFVMNFDIVPRIFLAPLQSIKKELQTILHILFSKSSSFTLSSVGNSQLVTFFTMVLRNSQVVTTKRACMLMRCMNPLLETFTSFTKLSPYRPIGAYVFCTGDRRLIIVNTSEAVLQLLFHLFQPGQEHEVEDVAYRSLKEHLAYESEVQKSFKMVDIVYLDNLESVLCPSVLLTLRKCNCSNSIQRSWVVLHLRENLTLQSAEAGLCLRAVGEQEKQKQRNQAMVDANHSKIKDAIRVLTEYREKCKNRGLGYYDTFKLQKHHIDFDANVKRIELAGLWDLIVEMTRKYELPGTFESREEWVELGTSYRRLVEPLDIANYYRHAKNEDTGPYMLKGRPSRYRYTQAWLECTHQMAMGCSSESCFWARVEELCIDTKNGKPYLEMKERILELEEQAEAWHSKGLLSGDVFLGESTFIKWWKTLPEEHRSKSHIRRCMDLENNNSSS